MADFEITDMPEDLLQSLRERARANGRTLDEEIIIRLERSTMRTPHEPPGDRASA